MQSELHPTQPDLNSTTVRNYSLVAQARENRDCAMAAWTEAYRLWQEHPTIANRVALLSAAEVHHKAEDLYTSVRISAKHNRGTVGTGLAQALTDAGFGTDGVL